MVCCSFFRVHDLYCQRRKEILKTHKERQAPPPPSICHAQSFKNNLVFICLRTKVLNKVPKSTTCAVNLNYKTYQKTKQNKNIEMDPSGGGGHYTKKLIHGLIHGLWYSACSISAASSFSTALSIVAIVLIKSGGRCPSSWEHLISAGPCLCIQVSNKHEACHSKHGLKCTCFVQLLFHHMQALKKSIEYNWQVQTLKALFCWHQTFFGEFLVCRSGQK